MINTDPASKPGLFQDGWYRFASKQPSPNFGPRPATAAIDLVVLHSISLPPGEYETGCVQDFFCNKLDWSAHPYFQEIKGMEVSCHFFIGRRGQLWQFVSVNDRAWHAGVSKHRGRENCNDYSIGVELEGLEGDVFEAAQYETLASLLAVLMQLWPISHVAGHEHVAPGRKQDPGPGFDWRQLQRLSGLGSQCFPEGLLT